MIHLRGVSKQFAGKRKVTALERLDLSIARGEMVSIVGPSGSGKSTLLNLIGGLDRPSEGEIEIDGEELTARCMLHETDHCDGIVFLDKMSSIKRELVKRKIKKLQKTGKWN